MNRHFICLYLKAQLRYIGFKFSAAILENMQLLLFFPTYSISMFFISHESTLHSSLKLKAELIYIRFRFSAAILAAILNFLFSLSYLYEKTWLSVCVCTTNGRPNGLPDLDQNLGMDSHLPLG